MKNATFYILNQNFSNKNLTIIEQFVCKIATTQWRNGARVLICCEDNLQALKLNKALWTNNPNSFIPHNLYTQKQWNYGFPIKICWTEYYKYTTQNLLINLLPHITEESMFFDEIIDFVPYKEVLRKLSRNRYKLYRNFGFQITTIVLPIF